MGKNNWLQPVNQVVHKWAYNRAVSEVSRSFVHPYHSNQTGWGRRLWRHVFGKWWFLYYRVPTDRAASAHYIQRCRKKAYLADDQRMDSVYLTWMALQLLPKKMREEREKRNAVTNWLAQTKLECMPEDMNFDPFIPYLAPYYEEARFILQEEEELLAFNPWHRRIFMGGYNGFGSKDRFKSLMANLMI